MRVLIYGAGVIGSIFAGRLARSGVDVTVLARGKRLEEIRRTGIVLMNPKTRRKETAHVKTIDTLEPSDLYTYVFVVMQRSQVDAVLPTIACNGSRNVVFVVNTAGGYDAWASALGPERLLIGFPSAGGERVDGVVQAFIGKGLLRMFQTTTFGECDGRRTERIDTLIRLFRRAGIPSVCSHDMDAWQKTHVALVCNVANALYGCRCDNVRLGRSRSSVRQMVLAIQEGRRVLRKNGIRPTPWKLAWLDAPAGIVTASFCWFMKTKLAETTMAKHCMVAHGEMRHLQMEFDALICRSGLHTPAIDRLREQLATYSPGERLT